MWIETLKYHELLHLTVGVFIGSFFLIKTKNLKLFIICLVVSILIDLDHLFDYFLFIKKLSFAQYFQGIDYFSGSNKVIVLGHSWELAILLAMISWVKKRPVFLAISLALMGHFLIDQLTYTHNPYAYCLVCRLAHDFSRPWFNGL